MGSMNTNPYPFVVSQYRLQIVQPACVSQRYSDPLKMYSNMSVCLDDSIQRMRKTQLKLYINKNPEVKPSFLFCAFILGGGES